MVATNTVNTQPCMRTRPGLSLGKREPSTIDPELRQIVMQAPQAHR